MRKESSVYPYVPGIREVFAQGMRFAFPREIQEKSDGLQTASEWASRGKGLIIVHNHFSQRDPLHPVEIIFSNPQMRKRRLVAPVAAHHSSPILEKLAERLAGTEIAPIVTQETFKQGKARGRHRNAGQADFMRKAAGALLDGGILTIAPQATREATLKTDFRTLGVFSAGIKRQFGSHAWEEIGLLFVGMGEKGVTDYSRKEVRGLRPLKVYEINVGKFYKLSDALAEAGGVRCLDGWIFETQLSGLVPPAYRLKNGDIDMDLS